MEYEFRDPLALARVVCIALIVWLASVAAYARSAAHTILTIGAYQAGSAGQDDLLRVDTVAGIVAIPTVIINLATIILVARWIYRANKNAHALSNSMVMTPAWNVGFFFIPFANLWKPFEGIREAWKASASPLDPEAVALPGWIHLWWASWILTNILGNNSFRLGMQAESLDDYVNVAWIELAILPLDLTAGITLLILVTRLSRIQHETGDVETQAAVFE